MKRAVVILTILVSCISALAGANLGNDGVFGLQRGFKNAGVHTLLMNLRQVDDRATTELMIQFYKHLMTGSTPNESLCKNGFDKAEYWTSFIILDGNN